MGLELKWGCVQLHAGPSAETNAAIDTNQMMIHLCFLVCAVGNWMVGTPQGCSAPYSTRPNGCDVPYASAAADWQPYGVGDTIGLVLHSKRVGWHVYAFKNGRYVGLMFRSAGTASEWPFEHTAIEPVCGAPAPRAAASPLNASTY